MLIAAVNLYALALVIRSLIRWPIWVSIIVSAGFVLAYITLGGLSGAIHNDGARPPHEPARRLDRNRVRARFVLSFGHWTYDIWRPYFRP